MYTHPVLAKSFTVLYHTNYHQPIRGMDFAPALYVSTLSYFWIHLVIRVGVSVWLALFLGWKTVSAGGNPETICPRAAGEDASMRWALHRAVSVRHDVPLVRLVRKSGIDIIKFQWFLSLDYECLKTWCKQPQLTYTYIRIPIYDVYLNPFSNIYDFKGVTWEWKSGFKH